ncbi:hypothetical protein DY000_02027012 [Brassica cretica]|uniref:Large ribosomal subunit protein uL4 C-terminal domain-containing protein n=1 Tax=Brassica cretica TaxID=69181 RepID=A0ABQ7DZM7_BRACR|nr:hypothetical protein DY000_02027012 [Brassica cretica]
MGISKKSSNVCTSRSSSCREPLQIDLARALSQVQSAVKPIKKDAKRAVMKKNLLKNLNVMLKLNPYAKTAKRMSLLAEAQRVKAKKCSIGSGRCGTSSLWTCLCAHKLDPTLRTSKASSVERSRKAEGRDYRYNREKDDRNLGESARGILRFNCSALRLRDRENCLHVLLDLEQLRNFAIHNGPVRLAVAGDSDQR